MDLCALLMRLHAITITSFISRSRKHTHATQRNVKLCKIVRCLALDHQRRDRQTIRVDSFVLHSLHTFFRFQFHFYRVFNALLFVCFFFFFPFDTISSLTYFPLAAFAILLFRKIPFTYCTSLDFLSVYYLAHNVNEERRNCVEILALIFSIV